MEMLVTEIDGPLTHIRLNGRLDSPGVDRIEIKFTAAVASRGHNVVVDLSGVDFLASMGIRMFIASARALHLKGAKMVLFGATEAVLSVLEHVALDQIIPIAATEAEAIERLSS
ncbi:MAG: STAS domain-containing protein [Burkholderiaceae bacterium]|nr:STAS domain-containing protein [Burkholderiaceae bacterium]